MIDDEYLELLNRAADEPLPPAERERLEAYLGANPEARRLHADLLRLPRVLGQIPQVQPGPELKENILRAIRRLPAPRRVGLFGSLPDYFRRRPVFAFAGSFSTGLAIGLGIFAGVTVFRRPATELDSARVAGTILPYHEESGLRPIAVLPLGCPDVSGAVTLKVAPGLVVVETEVSTSSVIELRLAFDPLHLAFHGYRDDGSGQTGLTVEADALTFAHQGKNRYVLAWRGDITACASPLILRVNRGGQSLCEVILFPPADK